MPGDEAHESFPPAEGVRVEWEALPSHVREGVEARLGSRVVHADTHSGGFSPGLAARLRTADDRDVFLKAVTSTPNPETVEIHRREARVAAALPRIPLTPRFQWCLDGDDWVALAFDYVPGANPRLPWSTGDLARVLRGMEDLAESLTPPPLIVETVGEFFDEDLMCWRDLVDDPEDLARIPPAWRDRLDELVDLEGRWPEAAAGGTLLHFDIRADNVVLGPSGVCFVDWPWATAGAAWVDLVAFLPSVAMQGGPDPEALWQSSRLSRGADRDAVDAFLAALAGMFTRNALLADPPGLPTLRAFQAAQGRTARAWLARRRGWSAQGRDDARP